MVYDFTASQEDSGKRLDLFLAGNIKEKGCSRTFLQHLILDNGVLVNNKGVKPHYKIHPGDIIRVVIPEENKALDIAAEDIKLKILYEDSDILIIDKPSGLVVHPAAGTPCGTLVNALLMHTRDLSSVNPARPGIVHRLDKETSGVMVVAKTNPAHLSLVRQFAVHTIKRKYIALVKGSPEHDEGVIDLPIGRHRADFRRQGVSFVNSRYAITRYRVIKRLAAATMLELIPETGRTHQLRVHLAHIGYPILGDSKYGKAGDFGRLALHAKELGFLHPHSGKFVSFSSEIPPEIAAFGR